MGVFGSVFIQVYTHLFFGVCGREQLNIYKKRAQDAYFFSSPSKGTAEYILIHLYIIRYGCVCICIPQKHSFFWGGGREWLNIYTPYFCGGFEGNVQHIQKRTAENIYALFFREFWREFLRGFCTHFLKMCATYITCRTHFFCICRTHLQYVMHVF